MESTNARARTGYEFSAAENETIARAARWVGFWSWVALVGGGLYGALGLVGAGEDIATALVIFVFAAVYIVLGLYYRGAATSMRSVVDTEGDDIPHLMTAIDKLAAAHKLMGMLMIIGFVLGLLAVIVVGGAAVAVGGGVG